jgi:arsenical pump membrane protein
LSFARFAALMSLPWVVAIVVEYAVFVRVFAADLGSPPLVAEPLPRPGVPVFTLGVVVPTLAGFVVTSFLGVSPARAVLALLPAAAANWPGPCWRC